VLAYLELRFVDLFAKAGVSSRERDARTLHDPSTPVAVVEASDEDFAWGAGIEARIRKIGVRLEYERFDGVSDDELDALSLSVTWTFD
jgi:hypothetical protein